MNSTLRLKLRPDALRRLRLGAVLGRKDLAERSGVSIATIKAAENGFSDGVLPETVRKLADGLGCKPTEISEVIEVAS